MASDKDKASKEITAVESETQEDASIPLTQGVPAAAQEVLSPPPPVPSLPLILGSDIGAGVVQMISNLTNMQHQQASAQQQQAQQQAETNANIAAILSQQLRAPTHMKAYEGFQKTKPPTFLGLEDPVEVEDWIKEIEKSFEIARTDEEDKVPFASYMLSGDAKRWWDTQKRIQAEKKYTWTTFLKEFRDHYIPPSLKREKVREFEQLVQGNMSVRQYDREFTRLSMFVSSAAMDEETRARKFEEGLAEEVRDHVVPFTLKTYAEILEKAIVVELNQNRNKISKEALKRKALPNSHGTGQTKKPYEPASNNTLARNSWCRRCNAPHTDQECRWNTGACFGCGKTGHRKSDCPDSRAIVPVATPIRTLAPVTKPHSQTSINRTPGRIFALTQDEAEKSGNVVTEANVDHSEEDGERQEEGTGEETLRD